MTPDPTENTALAAILQALRDFPRPRAASSSPRRQARRAGLLLAAFGTSVSQARVAFARLNAIFGRRFPSLEIRWAFSSPIVRRKMVLEREAEGGENLGLPEDIHSLTHALAAMLDEGFTHVAVQSLHTIPGFEYHQLLNQVRRFQEMRNGFKRLSVGRPLLSDPADVDRAARAALSSAPAIGDGEALALMGHGTYHAGGRWYGAVHARIQEIEPRAFIGAMEGALELAPLIAHLREREVRRVWLMPFMSVAGEHAVNDMAGDEDDSWRETMRAEGLEVACVMRGTAEFEEYAAIWADHAAEALTDLERDSAGPVAPFGSDREFIEVHG